MLLALGYISQSCGTNYRCSEWINEQMRTIAAQLKPDEMHVIAEFYGTGAAGAQVAATSRRN
jgi:hypothetical protein